MTFRYFDPISGSLPARPLEAGYFFVCFQILSRPESSPAARRSVQAVQTWKSRRDINKDRLRLPGSCPLFFPVYFSYAEKLMMGSAGSFAGSTFVAFSMMPSPW